MASSSRYIQLSSSVLMEYIYTDQNSLDTHTTAVADFYKMENSHTDEILIFNEDNAKSITGNVRDRSSILIDNTTNQYAYLDIDGIIAYNDTDSKVTSTSNLPIGLTATDTIAYDTIRLHFTQGFNFEQNEGLILEVDIERGDDKIIKLASFTYLKEDSFAELNSSPFLFGGRSYNSYIEFKIPAIYNLIQDYNTDYVVGGDKDIVAYAISDGLGFNQTTPISTKFGFISTVEKSNDQTYFTIYEQKTVILSKIDEFSTISASVKESSNGDYFELQPLENDNNIENFITSLNNTGEDYIILHDIIVKEHIPPSGWVKTADLQLAQISDFDEPVLYRPIIKNSSTALAYKIEYTARLYNRNDNTQIWKLASVISQDPKKYGKSLKKINLGTNPIISKVYNQIVNKQISLNSISASDTFIANEKSYAKYVTSFIDAHNISISNTTVYQEVIDGEDVLVENGSSENATKILSQGLANIQITPYDTFTKFVIYESTKEGTQAPINLAGVGTLCMNFRTSNGENICIEEFAYGGVNKSSGEIIFKIAQDEANKILGLNDRQFYITAKADSGAETLLYTGKFYGSGDFSNQVLQDKIEDLESSLSESRTLSQKRSNTIGLQNTEISEMQSLIDTLRAQISADDIEIDRLTAEINSLKSSQNTQSSSLSEVTETKEKGSLNIKWTDPNSVYTEKGVEFNPEDLKAKDRVSESQKQREVSKKNQNIKNNKSGTWN